jgi:hypothetical protein
VQQSQTSRFSYLEQKYGTSVAARIKLRKDLEGNGRRDGQGQLGTATKHKRVINGNNVREEWRYRSTVLHFSNNQLVDWGPVR